MTYKQFMEKYGESKFKFHSVFKGVVTYFGEGYQVFGKPEYAAIMESEMKLKDIYDALEYLDFLHIEGVQV